MFHVSTLLPHTPNNKQQVRTESPRIWSLLSCCTRKQETNLCVGSRCSGKSLRGGGCCVTNTGHDTVAQMTVLIFFPVWRNNALLLLSTCHFFLLLTPVWGRMNSVLSSITSCWGNATLGTTSWPLCSRSLELIPSHPRPFALTFNMCSSSSGCTTLALTTRATGGSGRWIRDDQTETLFHGGKKGFNLVSVLKASHTPDSSGRFFLYLKKKVLTRGQRSDLKACCFCGIVVSTAKRFSVIRL